MHTTDYEFNILMNFKTVYKNKRSKCENTGIDVLSIALYLSIMGKYADDKITDKT